jgi:DNA invertase Pin-like site-specific DNA recombinase
MRKQSGKSVALYYRTATKRALGQHLDNQMQNLLCYAEDRELDSFILYADNRASGITFDRLALNAMQQDIEAGRIGEIVVYDLSRIGRNVTSGIGSIKWARSCGAEVVSIRDGKLAELPFSFLRGGESA